jgi:hypothetical protein
MRFVMAVLQPTPIPAAVGEENHRQTAKERHALLRHPDGGQDARIDFDQSQPGATSE